jgi:Protein of unknown function (DUF3108)
MGDSGRRLQASGCRPVWPQADGSPAGDAARRTTDPGPTDRRARTLLAIGAALCGFTLTVVAATVPPKVVAMAPPTERAVPFRVGETLEYDVGWSSYLTAGSATLAIREKKPSYGSVAYYAIAEGRATGLVAALYHVYYKADTLLDVYSLLPQRGSIYGEEGRRRRMRATRFDQKKRTAHYEVTPGGGPQKPIALPGPTHDALSVVLALRTLRLREGLSVTLPVSDGGRVFRVQARVRERQRLSTRLGHLMAWRVEPVIVGDGGEVGASKLTLWLSDDAQKWPLLMEAEMPVGKVTLTLRSARM